MNVYDVFCKEKKGYWRVLADFEEEAIYSATKGNEHFTGVFVGQVG